MSRAFDQAMKAFLATCALFAILAACATYLCATGAMPCRDAVATECPYDAQPSLRGTIL